MATIEREHDLHERALHERPVFVAADGRRARRLRIAAGVVAVLALLWLVALAAGTFGFGRLPGIATPLARIGGGDPKPERSNPAKSIPTPSEERTAAVVVDSEQKATRTIASARGSASASTARAGARARAARRGAARPPAAVQPAQPPAQPVAPPPQQGWSRHGRPAPPGYTRRTQQQPAPPPGQAQAPGQAKKALVPPPPPPPPPPGNGNGGGPKKA